MKLAEQESLKTSKIIYFVGWMKTIIHHTIHYFRSIDKRILTSVSLFTAVFVYINYTYGLDTAIRKNSSLLFKLIAWYLVFLTAFGIPYVLYSIVNKTVKHPGLLLLIFIAPAIFAIKISLRFPFHFSDNPLYNEWWNHIVYWPLLLLITTILVYLTWQLTNRGHTPFAGLKTKDIYWKPYWLMLLIMLPLIAVASTQPDFLAVYPKLQSIAVIDNTQSLSTWQKLLFELSYGSDFLTIELFFRGFLVLGFMKWAGKDAILPMACFYCAIHFGKPLGECISSYFGGILLGVVVYHTRSIFGGLMVHLGIAWLMELGGFLGNKLL